MAGISMYSNDKPSALLALPEALRDKAAQLLAENSFDSAASVERFGRGTLTAAEDLSQRFSRSVLGHGSEAAHQTITAARALVMLLDPSISKRAFPVRLAYGFRTMGLANKVSQMAAAFDKVALDLVRQDETLRPFVEEFEQLTAELNVGSAVLQAAGEDQHRALQSSACDDVLWRQSQYDRLILREALFRTLRVSSEAQMRTLIALRSALLQLLGLVEGFSNHILPLWRRHLTSITGFYAIFPAQKQDPSALADIILTLTDQLADLDRLAEDIDQMVGTSAH